MRNDGTKAEFYGEYQDYLLRLGTDNADAHNRLLKNLSAALTEELTPRQREAMTLYYITGLNMRQVAREMGVNISTVSRTLERGRRRLCRCLRYGARELLDEAGGPRRRKK